MTEKFSSSLHCNHLFRKCSQIASLILQSFISRNKDLMLRAYKVYIIPLLYYCSTVYSPHKISDINFLQRLEVRRIHNDLFLAYKMIHGKTPGLNILSICEKPSITRSSDKTTFVIEKFSLDLRKFDFTCRTSKIWNSLPKNVIDCANLDSFKRKILQTNFNMFLKGRD